MKEQIEHHKAELLKIIMTLDISYLDPAIQALIEIHRDAIQELIEMDYKANLHLYKTELGI